MNGYRFTVDCPDCSSAPRLVHEMTAGSGDGRQQSAIVHCTRCDGRWQVHVALLRSSERRFPWRPLAEAVAARIGTDSPRAVADYLDAHYASTYRWAAEGLPLARADHFATARMNVPPTQIWPDFYADIPLDDIDLEVDATEGLVSA